MANKANKKALVRNQIITASNVYSNGLAGKMFLYVFGNEFFEVVFKTDRFMHLSRTIRRCLQMQLSRI